jgi:hypothetical protein
MNITNDYNIITKEFLVIKNFFATIFPKDVIHYILHYSILLKHKDFLDNKNFKQKWNDFNIPLTYYYFLTLKQECCLKSILTQKPYTNPGLKNPPALYYKISPEEYTVFTSLPKELRLCLTFLPNSKLKNFKNYSSYPINKNKEILISPTALPEFNISTELYHHEAKPIMPELQNSKK